MIFIDLEKAYDRVNRDVMWRVLEKRGVRVGYIESIKDMYVFSSLKLFRNPWHSQGFSNTTKTPFTDCSVNGVHYLDIDTDIHILPFGKFEMVNH